MSTSDQAFFAAYGPAVSAGVSQQEKRPTTSPRGQSDRQRSGTAIESQYTDGSWYRVDAAHRDERTLPAPHRAPAAVVQQIPAEASPAPASDAPNSWEGFTGWSNSCVVMATPLSIDEAWQAPVPSAAPAPAPQPAPAARSARVPEPEPMLPEDEELPEEVPAAAAPHAEDECDSVAPQPAGAWTAVWEVDEFVWTDELERLQTAQAEYFRYAGEKLLEASREGLKTLAVVATREREGCTTMAVCLAQAAALAGGRVALVDANLDHPELGPRLGLDFSHGWQEALNGQGDLREAAVLALDTGLTLLPLSATHRLPSLDDPRVSATLQELASHFDLVIVDAGVSPTGDAEMFEAGVACPLNAALIVRDLRRTSETETLVTASRLKALGIDAIGIAENFVPRQSARTAA